MDHVSVNATNFWVVGLMSSLFIGGGLFVVIWLANMNLPVITPVARVILGVVHKL